MRAYPLFIFFLLVACGGSDSEENSTVQAQEASGTGYITKTSWNQEQEFSFDEIAMAQSSSDVYLGEIQVVGDGDQASKSFALESEGQENFYLDADKLYLKVSALKNYAPLHQTLRQEGGRTRFTLRINHDFGYSLVLINLYMELYPHFTRRQTPVNGPITDNQQTITLSLENPQQKAYEVQFTGGPSGLSVENYPDHLVLNFAQVNIERGIRNYSSIFSLWSVFPGTEGSEIPGSYPLNYSTSTVQVEN